MKLNIVTISFDVSRRAKRMALVLGSVTGILAASAVAVADPPAAFKDGEVLSASKLNDNFAGLDIRIKSLEGAPAAVPAGTIIAYAAETVPAGWAPCDGTELDGTNPTYAALYGAIGVSFGGNPGFKKFNVPDLRGRFLRGWNNGAGDDPDAKSRLASGSGGVAGDHVGSYEKSAFASHNHGGKTGHEQWDGTGNGIMYNNQPQVSGIDYIGGGQPVRRTGDGEKHRHEITPEGGSETRPVNISVNYIIKL